MAQTVTYYITHRTYDVNVGSDQAISRGSRLLNTSLWSQCQCCTPIGTLEKNRGSDVSTVSLATPAAQLYGKG